MKSIATALTIVVLCNCSPIWADALLLRNGNTLEGDIRRTERHYVVRNDNGTTIHIPNSKVEVHAKSLDDLYRWKLRRTDATNVRAQVRLANWCLQEGLIHDATDRLLYLSRTAPDHAAVKTLEKQIRNRMRPKSRVVRAAAHVPVPSIPQKLPNRVRHSIELKDDSVLEFRRVVQPLLINRCGQSSCHGSASRSDFRLVQFKNLRPNRQLTLKNLDTVLNLLDEKNPPDSELLIQSLKLHGSQKSLAFEPREIHQYRKIQRWVFNLLDYTEPSDESFEATSQPARENIGVQKNSAARENPNVPPKNVTPPEKTVRSDEIPSRDSVDEARETTESPEEPNASAASSSSANASAASTSPGDQNRNNDVDPFDPQSFNRMVHRE